MLPLHIALSSLLLLSLDSYTSALQAIEMSSELHRCTRGGNLKRVRQLVEGGANIEETNEDGMTALLLAIQRKGDFEIVMYLIVERGADVAHITLEGQHSILGRA
jgi:ankyrin repeat protein